MSQIIKKKGQQELKTAHTLLLLMMFGWIEKTMNEGDEVCVWVNQKYGMNRMIQKFKFCQGGKLLLACWYHWCYVELTN